MENKDTVRYQNHVDILSKKEPSPIGDLSTWQVKNGRIDISLIW
jgi:hypothetical protein